MRGVAAIAAALLLPLAAPQSGAAQQAGPSMADRLANDPRVEALIPYGQAIAPVPRGDKGVQFGKMLRFKLNGSPDFAHIGIVSPTLKPVKKGDKIVIAFWARATDTDGGLPGKIGRVQLEATPVVRTIFEKTFEIGPEWKMYQFSGTADADYKPRALNAALHIDSVRQTLDIGPVFIFDYGIPAQ